MFPSYKTPPQYKTRPSFIRKSQNIEDQSTISDSQSHHYRYRVETEEKVFPKIDSKRDQSKRLYFEPFQFRYWWIQSPFLKFYLESRQISNEKEVGYLRRTIKTSSKIAETFKFDLSMYSKLALRDSLITLINRNRGLNNKVFSQLSQELKKTRGLKVFDLWIDG